MRILAIDTSCGAASVAVFDGETQQMLSSINRYRRSRGAQERSLEEITKHAWASLEQQDAP